MGNCASAEYLEKQEIDENVVYMVDEEAPISEKDGTRKIASLFSQRGKKGPNQDTAILCQVHIIGFSLDLRSSGSNRLFNFHFFTLIGWPVGFNCVEQ